MAKSRNKPKIKTLSAIEALRLLEERVQAAQSELAARTDAGADMLQYLAQNGAVATRCAVAANPAATPEANLLLAGDDEDEVRINLARKIGRLFPGMLVTEEKHLRDLAVETLEKLAADQAPRVRAILAEEIKRLDCIPKRIVKKLARDVETIVAAPIVEFSPLLGDAELIEIVAAAETNAMMNAVARRKGLTAGVSDAVVATRNTEAIAALLKNVDAAIRKRTLDKIVSQAAEIAEWHGPLVLRAELSPEAIRRLSSFVSSALIGILVERNGLSETTRANLERKLAQRRTQEQEEEEAEREHAAVHVATAKLAGKLDGDFITEAVEARHKDTVVCALSQLTKVHEVIVRTILDSGSAKAVTALVWKAGLNMRVAYKLQTSIMRLSRAELLPARDGVNFPLSEEEMRFHLDFFGVK